MKGGDAFSVMEEEGESMDLRNDADAVIANRTRSRNVRAVMLAVASIAVFAVIISGLVVASFYALLFPVAGSDGRAAAVEEEGTLESALSNLSEAVISAHVEFLSSDLLEGRGTGTRGEALAVQYIAAQLQQLPRMHTRTQAVPLFGSTPKEVESGLTLDPAGASLPPFVFVDDFLVTTDLEDSSIELFAESFVFVGYGIDAEDWEWNDYKDFNVTGKVLVSFVNDPPATDEDPDLFLGETLTYYGRWTYKYEEARRRGAAAIFLIHTLETAGYPYSVLSNGGQGEHVQLQDFEQRRLTAKGWLTKDSAEAVATACSTSLEEWFEMASSRDFNPIEYEATISLSSTFTTRSFEGTNVLGILPGLSEAGDDAAILLTGHHDHLGIGPPDQTGDTIYNGAIDNASGCALVLAAAAAMAGAEIDRTVVFATVTAEESGLLGSQYLAEHTEGFTFLANINFDVVNVYGSTEDIVPIYDPDQPVILPLVEDCAAKENLTISPDPEPEQGEFFRSDQLSFARVKTPAVMLKGGCRYVGQEEGYCGSVRDDYRLNHYHQPSDEFDPDWDLSGVIQLGRVGIRMIYALADAHFTFPEE